MQQFAASATSGARSGLGQKRRFDRLPDTSGLPQLSDIFSTCRYVSNVPTPEMAQVAPNKKPPEGGSLIQT
jgi:hypothetical protein